MTLLRHTLHNTNEEAKQMIRRMRDRYTVEEIEEGFRKRELDEEFYEIGQTVLSNNAARTTCIWTGFELVVRSKHLDRRFESLAA